MKCRQCKGELSRDGKWFSIRVYELDGMIALPFCTGLCLAKHAADEWDKVEYIKATRKKV